MQFRHVLLLAVGTVLLVFLATAGWEFLFEEIFVDAGDGGHEDESAQEHWEYIVTATAASVIAVILSGLASLRIIAERRRAERALEKSHDELEERVLERTAELSREIADRNRVENALRESEGRLRILMDNVPGFIYQRALHPDGTITFPFVNEGVFGLVGLTPEEVMANPSLLIEIIDPEDRESYAAAIRRSAGSFEPLDMEFRVVLPTGERKWVRSNSRPRAREDGTIVWDALVLDITDRWRAAAQLHDAKEQAEFANRAKSEFLANMSHELRTPLNAILGFSDIIKSETFGPVGSVKYRDYVEDIHQSGKHLLDLINDILDLSKVESGTTDIDDEEIEIAEVLASVETLVRERARQGGIDLNLDLPARLPPLRADRRKLKQILINLMSNAIKFTNPGGRVVLKVWHRTGSGIVFQVVDTGIGMALGDIPKALAPFGQIDSGLGRMYEGTGLGLPLTKALVEMHSGSLDLQSEVGVGTTVTVRFPAERVVVVERAADERTARPADQRGIAAG